MHAKADLACLKQAQEHHLNVVDRGSAINTLPGIASVREATSRLVQSLPTTGKGIEQSTDHLLEDISPGLNSSSLSSTYYGFVTGGVTPAARVAEAVVATYDQNVQVHLPNETVATAVEAQALGLLLDLLRLDRAAWLGRTFTTGATASNVLGLACGREFVINAAVERASKDGGIAGPELATVGEGGLLRACQVAGIQEVQILTTFPHSSILKAASIVGFGRRSVVSICQRDDPLAFDFVAVEKCLSRANAASIVVVSCGEVNTGLFATQSWDEMARLRSLCDKYNAWLHVDGGPFDQGSHFQVTADISAVAFGLFVRVLEGLPEFDFISHGAAGVELADSITGDAHKMLNVPYDCGFYFNRRTDLPSQVFQNSNAAYLSQGAGSVDPIPSPLNIGLENSRRFRALPVYATLVCYGRNGYTEMMARQVRFARAVASFLEGHPAFELLPKGKKHHEADRSTFIVVLFRAKDAGLNRLMVEKINAGGDVYFSGTTWQGSPASRMAVSNWQVDLLQDLPRVKAVLGRVARE